MSQRNTFFSLLVVALFLMAISLPLVGAIVQEDRGLSYSEKRKLQQFPEKPSQFEDIPTFVAEFEKYFNDQFGFREYFLKGYSKVKGVLGDHDISSAAQNVGTSPTIEGKNGWFFLNRKWDGDPVADYRNLHLYSENELLRATLLFAARTDWLQSLGVEYLFFFAPNKHTIYSEYLPDYITKIGNISAWDQLNDSLERYTNVNIVDLRRVLKESKNQAAPYWQDKKDEAALYYKKDSHWNGAGADIAQYVIAQKMEELFPGKIGPKKRDPADFEMLQFTGDITLIMGRNEKEAYGPILPGSICTEDRFEDYLQRYHESICEQKTLNAIFFNDSFGPPLKPYFTDYFRHTLFLWESMTKKKTLELVKRVKPQIVLEQRAERFLPFTPKAYGENYPLFWDKHWPKWKETVFDLKNIYNENKLELEGNASLQILPETRHLQITTTSNDPHFLLPEIAFTEDDLYLVRVVLTSSHATTFQIYYSSHGKENEFPVEPRSFSVPVKKGRNVLYLPLLSMDLSGKLRVDPAKIAGQYGIEEFVIKKLQQVNLKN